MKTNFVISCDSCVDIFKSYLDKKNVHSITMKRVLNGNEISEHYNSTKEFDAFYEAMKKGALPTTVAINPSEMQQHFEEILKKDSQCESSQDIIHLPLSSGLSTTCDNAIKAAAELNKTLKNRKIHVIDTFGATLTMGYLCEELIELRDKGTSTKDAIKRIEELRDHMQIWIIMTDLFNLKRGGRISGVKATIGTLLKINPIIILNHIGKLAIENKMKGNKHAIDYVLAKMQKLGKDVNKNFDTSTVYVVRTSQSKLYEDTKAAVAKKYPNMKMKEGIVGPIIGSHLGCNSTIVIFEGAKRLEVE